MSMQLARNVFLFLVWVVDSAQSQILWSYMLLHVLDLAAGSYVVELAIERLNCQSLPCSVGFWTIESN